MPDWGQVLTEIQKENAIGPSDRIRWKYLKKLFKTTKRNVIAYYSGWLQKPNISGTSINDNDMNAFMTTIHELDKTKGLDLLLHTPGGDLAATESIVEYLRKIFGTNIRMFVPHLAMSAGTMIACSGKEIVMGKHSSLGPIDPQFNGLSAEGVLEEFRTAKKEITEDSTTISAWQIILNKYHPTFIGDCQKAIKWSYELAEGWLGTGMFKDEADPKPVVAKILKVLTSHEKTGSHARHISIDKCQEMGLKVVVLEDIDNDLQDLILTVHHSYMNTFSTTRAVKIIENHKGRAMVNADIGK